MIFTFFRAKGFSVGSSMVEESQVGLAKQLVAKAAENGVKLHLPTDVVVADKYSADARTQVVSADQISDEWMVSHFLNNIIKCIHVLCQLLHHDSHVAVVDRHGDDAQTQVMSADQIPDD